MKLFGCLFVLIALAGYGVVEWWLAPRLVADWLGRWSALRDQVGHPLLLSYLGMIATTIIGVVLAKRQIAALPHELAGAFMGVPGANLGRRVVTLAGAVLLAIPGYATDVLGLLLILPPMPWLLGKAGAAIGMAVVRVSMKRMMGGGGGGPFAGGMAGFAGFPFPKPDGSMPFPRPGAGRPGRTYDVQPERDHDRLKG